MIPRCSYVVPFRGVDVDATELVALSEDLRRVADAGCEVIVVDGSPAADFSRHRAAWGHLYRHVPVDPRWTFLNGKVNGVLTGVELASTEHVILADDDVSYSARDVDDMCHLLASYDLVVPQNYFQPLPWWARIETGRMLLNRALRSEGDFPGTCGLRRSVLTRIGPYDGDVLFENEEMRRHFLRHGARVRHARDFLIARRPPALAKWREQRVRQAYEDLDQRGKTALFAALVPIAAVLAWRGDVLALGIYALGVALIAVLLAAYGRRGTEARVAFPASVCLATPLWVAERACSVHRALWARVVRGGCRYTGHLVPRGIGEGKVPA